MQNDHLHLLQEIDDQGSNCINLMIRGVKSREFNRAISEKFEERLVKVDWPNEHYHKCHAMRTESGALEIFSGPKGSKNDVMHIRASGVVSIQVKKFIRDNKVKVIFIDNDIFFELFDLGDAPSSQCVWSTEAIARVDEGAPALHDSSTLDPRVERRSYAHMTKNYPTKVSPRPHPAANIGLQIIKSRNSPHESSVGGGNK